jgi:signal peptidase II
MKPKDHYLVIVILILTVFIDQITKMFAWNNFGALEFFGPFGLVRHRNPGAMLGLFSDLPPLLRVVSLSTGGAFLIFIFGIIQFLIPIKAMQLRVGMALLLGGILGNVIDRILEGSVVDFLVISMFGVSTAAFNYADLIQWFGYFLIVWYLIAHGQKFWPDKNFRKQVWVNPKYQIKYILLLIGMTSAFSLVLAVFSFTYLKLVIDELVVGPAQYMEKKLIGPYLFVFFVINTTFLLSIFIFGRLISHRTAGPVYAFEKYIDELISGKSRDFKLRAGDEFKQLQSTAKRLSEFLQTQTKKSSDGDSSNLL